MRIAVAATPAIAIPALEALSRNHEIVAVFTQPDKPFGRGRQIRQSEVAEWAQSQKLPLFKEISHPDILASVDLVVTVAYGVLIKEELLSLPRHGFINLHYSLLPRWRGAAPVQRALLAGDRETGVSVFQLEKGMDTGPIHIQEKITISREWNAAQLFDVLNQKGSQALLDAIAAIEAGIAPREQSGVPTLAPKIEKSEYGLTFDQPAEQVRNRIRALYPNAYFFINGVRVKVVAAHEGAAHSADIATIISIEPLTIACADLTTLVIERVIPEGKREMLSSDWLRGVGIEIGQRIG